MATILAFDTSAAHCAAALLRDGQIIARVEPMSRGQGERLMVLLQEVLDETEINWADLDAIAVGTGPGNFTGIRIAVSAARGLALGLGKPAIGVSNFDAVAHGLPRPSTALWPAPRNQRYALEFDDIKLHAPYLEDGEAPTHDAHAIITAIVEIAAMRLTDATGDILAPPRFMCAHQMPPHRASCRR